MSNNHSLKFGPVKYQQKGGTIALAIVVFAFLFLGYFALHVWIVMLLVGALHHSIWASIPAFGFWKCALIVVALWTLHGLFSKGGSK